MSYRESSILASFLITLAIWGDYALSVLNLYQQQDLTVGAINSLLLSAVLCTIFLEIVVQTIVAVLKPKEANESSDERDKLIAMKTNAYAYHILSFGFFCIIFYLIFPSIAQYNFATLGLRREYEVIPLMIILRGFFECLLIY